MRDEAELKRLDIVMLGDFNPKIFSPSWLASQDLIRSSESEQSDVGLIHPDIAAFSLPWCSFQIQRERFSASTEQEPYFTILGDLLTSIFSLLIHTPIHSLGLNWGFHFKCDSVDEWHNFGYFVAPKNPWRGIIDDSGMLRVEVTEKNLPENPLSGRFTIRIQPSKKFETSIDLNFHKHFVVPDKQNIIGCEKILETLKNNFEESKKEAESMISILFKNFESSIE